MADEESSNLITTSSRKRASKACLACRARKVRCDVVQQKAPPCTNCILDNQTCIVKPRPNKYKSAQSKSDNVDSNRSGAPPKSNSRDAYSTPNVPGNFSQLPLPNRGKKPSDVFAEFSGEYDASINNSPPVQGGEKRSEDSLDQHDTPTGNPIFPAKEPDAPFQIIDSPEQIDNESRSTLESHVMFSFYPFLELDILSHMSSQDVNILEQSGCFRVPRRPALDEFVREYFMHVHPSLPMLDEGEFWDGYMSRSSIPSDGHRMSLFVFQAMLFAACSFVSLETVQSLGFSTIRSARGTFYRRAKLLFDFNGESDVVLSAQGALLLSYNSSMRNLKRLNTFWLGISIQFAKDADAHRYDTNSNLSPHRKNILKRLWWCCIIRDRILPLGVRRPLHISSTDFDFTAAPMVREDFYSEVTKSKVYDAASKRLLTDLFITLCHLAVVLTDVIMVIYPFSEYSDTGIEASLGRIATCKSGLNSWFERATLLFPTPAGLSDTHESITLYTNLMYMYYHSANIALYNHEVIILATRSTPGEPHWDLMCQSKRHIEEGTAGMTENLKELIQLKLSKYMPISVVAYAALPLILHILDVKLSNTASQKARKQGRLNIYGEAMKAFKHQYDGTDEVSGFIGRMIDHISLEPVAPTSPSSPWGGAQQAQDSPQNPGWLRASHRSPSRVNEWSDVMLRQPGLYSRLIMTIDLSLSKGQFPVDTDFPAALQSKSIFGTRFPFYRIITGGGGTSRVSNFIEAPEARENHNHNHNHNHPRPEEILTSSTGNFQETNQQQLVVSQYNTPNYGNSDLLMGQMHKLQDGNVLGASEYDMPMYFGTFSAFDMGTPGDVSMMGDHPTGWTDGMFSDAL